MISINEIENKVKKSVDTIHLEVIDLRGGDHIQLIVVSPEFEGKSLLEKHKIIYDVLDDEIKSNSIHALTLKTYSPSEWEKIKDSFSKEIGHEI